MVPAEQVKFDHPSSPLSLPPDPGETISGCISTQERRKLHFYPKQLRSMEESAKNVQSGQIAQIGGCYWNEGGRGRTGAQEVGLGRGGRDKLIARVDV